VIEVNPNELKRAVESQHGCTATLIQSVPIKETFDGKTVWETVSSTFFKSTVIPRPAKPMPGHHRLRAAISGGFLRSYICRRLRRR